MLRHVPVRERERRGERDHVVLGRHARRRRERRVQAQDLVHDRVEVVQACAVRELFPARVGPGELLLELCAQTLLQFGLPREFNQGPLSMEGWSMTPVRLCNTLVRTVRLTGVEGCCID